MPFVKLDCGILDSTLWFEKDAREIFITALLMAEPYEVREPTPALAPREIKETGFVVPPGWYGFVRAAGQGIIARAQLDQGAGMAALESLSRPDDGSRSPDFEGRRMVRVSGGYIILNYDKYRERDYTGAERQKRYRERKRNGVTPLRHTVTHRDVTAKDRGVTQVEAEVEVEAQKKGKTPPNPPKGEQGALPVWLDVQAWNEFLQHRADIKQPLSELAIKKNLNVLERHKDRQQEIIDKTIASRWSGLFDPKTPNKGGTNETGRKLSAVERVEQANGIHRDAEPLDGEAHRVVVAQDGENLRPPLD